MNEQRQPPHDDMLDDLAVYALGALPPKDVRRVREHIATCAQCRAEYDKLVSAVSLVGLTAETAGDARECPSTLLKPRIMRQIRGETPTTAVRAEARSDRAPVWPAYLVAAACLAIAIISSVYNVALTGQLKQAQVELARTSQRSTSLARNLAAERTTLSDLLDPSSKHYAAGNGEIVTRGSRVYIALHALPEPPRGKIYQAWTLPKGAKKVAPSSTFVPDSHGVVLIALPADARTLSAVAVSVEPEGGSKQPTTKPIVIVPLT